MRKLTFGLLILILAVATTLPSRADGVSANAAFEELKGLAGTWSGGMDSEGAEAEAEAATDDKAVHEIAVSAAGTVVMETMAPGTQYEMINMYHLDGDDLVLTHYCAGGNQPTMKLDRAASTADKLVFEFTGGTNLDPAKDPHIHSAEIRLLADNKIDSIWHSQAAGEPAGTMTFHLAKQ
jgi:hypothetical protein